MIQGSKSCGVSDPETLNYILNHNHPPKFVGFISNYKKSKRYVAYENIKKLTKFEKKGINFVSVLVDPDDNFLEKIKNISFDYYQLYDVDPTRTKYIKDHYGKKIISALTISNEEDIGKYMLYQKISDIILFDGKGYEKSEGFDHNLLNGISKNLTIMIAGNINIDNIPIIKNLDYFIDVSGSLENERGDKDLKKIDNFLNSVHNIITLKKYDKKLT